MPTALFPGRFQPLPHVGHEQVLLDLFKKHNKVIIVLGSSNRSRYQEHVLNIEERKEVLEVLLQSLEIDEARYEIVAVPDIDSYPEYVKHLEGLVPPFDIVYSGNSLVQRLFREAGYNVCDLEMYSEISGTKLRKLMLDEQDFERYIPEKCQPFVEKFNIIKRLKSYEKAPHKNE